MNWCHSLCISSLYPSFRPLILFFLFFLVFFFLCNSLRDTFYFFIFIFGWSEYRNCLKSKVFPDFCKILNCLMRLCLILLTGKERIALGSDKRFGASFYQTGNRKALGDSGVAGSCVPCAKRVLERTPPPLLLLLHAVLAKLDATISQPWQKFSAPKGIRKLLDFQGPHWEMRIL